MSTSYFVWVRGGGEHRLAEDVAKLTGGTVDDILDVHTDDSTFEIGRMVKVYDPDFADYPFRIAVRTDRDPEAYLIELVHALARPPYEALLATENFDADHPIARWDAESHVSAAEESHAAE